jgi:hypothetical protein
MLINDKEYDSALKYTEFMSIFKDAGFHPNEDIGSFWNGAKFDCWCTGSGLVEIPRRLRHKIPFELIKEYEKKYSLTVEVKLINADYHSGYGYW